MDIVLRRLTAVKLGPRAMSTALAQFLASSKQKYLDDIRAGPARGTGWTVVMGNEAGGEWPPLRLDQD